MDGEIISRARVCAEILEAWERGDTSNPYPPGTAAHGAWNAVAAGAAEDTQS